MKYIFALSFDLSTTLKKKEKETASGLSRYTNKRKENYEDYDEREQRKCF
jgi:hypothetical protein